tara:strand:- start:183 stop:440 length:258 start_codon:yes stop_codon:yes gene_type:complete
VSLFFNDLKKVYKIIIEKLIQPIPYNSVKKEGSVSSENFEIDLISKSLKSPIGYISTKGIMFSYIMNLLKNEAVSSNPMLSEKFK